MGCRHSFRNLFLPEFLSEPSCIQARRQRSGFICWLWAVLWGFFRTSTMIILAENGIYRRKIDDKISGHPKPASFVPHWFIMLALTVTVIAVLSAIVMPILRK